MKKHISTLILCALVFQLAVSCGETSSDTIIYDSSDVPDTYAVEELNAEPVNNAIFKRNRSVEARLNINLDVQAIASGDAIQDIRKGDHYEKLF